MLGHNRKQARTSHPKSVKYLIIFSCISVATLPPVAACADVIAYQYDTLGRVIQVNYDDGASVSYRYDSAGNRIQVSRTAAPNRLPTAISDTLALAFNTGGSLNPLLNDLDPDGDPLAVTAVGTASHGSTSFNANNVSYVPQASYSGADSFTYTVSDGRGGTATGTVNVTVANGLPFAANDSISTGTNTPVTFNPRSNDSDPNGDSLTISATGTASHGTVSHDGVSITYIPATGYTGSDSFTYTISDGRGGSASATVSVTVNNAIPVASNDSVVTATSTPVTFDPRGNDSDANGDTLTISAVGLPTHGTVSHNGISVTYTPVYGYSGPDSFTYTLSDGRGGTASATVSINVNNAAPSAGNDTVSTAFGTPVTFDPRGNDSDQNGDPLTITAVGGAGHGSATTNGSTITYTPTNNYSGSDAFTYTISDGKGGTATATVSVSIGNGLPYAGSDTISTAYNGSTTFDPRGNDGDPNGDALTIIAVGSAANGTTSYTGASVSYVPNVGYSGTDNFTYTLSDGRGGTATATVSVTVQGPTVVSLNVTAAANLRSLADANGYNGSTSYIYQFTVPVGTTIMGAANGGRAIETGAWPAGVPVTLTVNGHVYGGGGKGGNAASSSLPGAGSAGGDAVFASAPISIIVNAGGSIQGGGGGGGAGSPTGITPGPGGGGGGFPNGPGGTGISGGNTGNSGTTSGGGTGGRQGTAISGGKGGNAGQAGSFGKTDIYDGGAGGAAGYAIRKNGNSVSVTNNGTIVGAQN